VKELGDALYNFKKNPVSPIIKATIINPRKKSRDNSRPSVLFTAEL
jgi:hypothetical protein